MRFVFAALLLLCTAQLNKGFKVYTDFEEFALQKYEKYCNKQSLFSKSNFKGDIAQVHVIYRHGDRTPTNYMDDDPKLEWNCTFVPNLTYSSTVLQPKITRDESFLEEVGWKGNCTKGQLTIEGHEQMKMLGVHLRKRYSHRFHQGQVFFRSTMRDRTVSSTLSLGEGMGLKRITAKIIPYNRDTLHARQAFQSCEWLQKNVAHAETTNLNLFVLKRNKDYVQHLDSIENWLCRYCHDKPQIPDLDLIDKMYRLRSWFKHYLHIVFPNEYLNKESKETFYKLSVGPLLNDIVDTKATTVAHIVNKISIIDKIMLSYIMSQVRLKKKILFMSNL
jgi:hypothetical protein